MSVPGTTMNENANRSRRIIPTLPVGTGNPAQGRGL